jgi:hypothetical protein
MRKNKEDEVAKLKEEAAAEASRIRREASDAAESLVREKTAESEKALIEARAKREDAESKLAKFSEEYEGKLNERLQSQRKPSKKRRRRRSTLKELRLLRKAKSCRTGWPTYSAFWTTRRLKSSAKAPNSIYSKS